MAVKVRLMLAFLEKEKTLKLPRNFRSLFCFACHICHLNAVVLFAETKKQVVFLKFLQRPFLFSINDRITPTTVSGFALDRQKFNHHQCHFFVARYCLRKVWH